VNQELFRIELRKTVRWTPEPTGSPVLGPASRSAVCKGINFRRAICVHIHARPPGLNVLAAWIACQTLFRPQHRLGKYWAWAVLEYTISAEPLRWLAAYSTSFWSPSKRDPSQTPHLHSFRIDAFQRLHVLAAISPRFRPGTEFRSGTMNVIPS